MDKTKQQILKITGERIRRARIIKGLTQTELATLCGYTDGTTIYKIEKGKQDIPTSKIRALCSALDVDFNYLKGDADYIVRLDDSEILLERQGIDERRERLTREISDLLSQANESQLKQITAMIKIIVGGNNGDADL